MKLFVFEKTLFNLFLKVKIVILRYLQIQTKLKQIKTNKLYIVLPETLVEQSRKELTESLGLNYPVKIKTKYGKQCNKF